MHMEAGGARAPAVGQDRAQCNNTPLLHGHAHCHTHCPIRCRAPCSACCTPIAITPAGNARETDLMRSPGVASAAPLSSCIPIRPRGPQRLRATAAEGPCNDGYTKVSRTAASPARPANQALATRCARGPPRAAQPAGAHQSARPPCPALPSRPAIAEPPPAHAGGPHVLLLFSCPVPSRPVLAGDAQDTPNAPHRPIARIPLAPASLALVARLGSCSSG